MFRQNTEVTKKYEKNKRLKSAYKWGGAILNPSNDMLGEKGLINENKI